jgi:iron complex outermembrane receptor protein
MHPIAACAVSCSRALLACWSVVILSTAASAQTSTGVIAGTVADGNTRQFLNQAEVRIQGTQLVALTDNEGYFRLAGVPAGTQTVLLNYLGLRPGNFSVTVAAGQTVTRAFELKSDEVLKLGEFVVAAEREGQAAAINQQRNADHMKSVVAADAFGSLHDNNAAELLKNIPGIALNYLGEDATGFSMRGEDSTYASITSDGDPMASGANNGPSGRQINFRNVTVNNVESVEVHRAPTAAQPANALGGSINFVSKSAFSQKGRRLRFDVGANFNTDAAQQARSYEGPDHEAFTIFPAAQVNYSDSFRHESGHPIGIVANALLGGRYLHNTAFNRTYTYVPAVAAGQQVTASTPAIANSLIVREAAAGWRQRSLGVNADYKLSDRTTVFLRGSYQEGPQSYMYGLNHSLTMTAANQTSGAGAAMIPINGNSANTMDSRPNATPVAAGSSTGSRFTKTTGTELADNQLYSFSGGVKQRFGNLNLDYSAYYSRAFDRRDPGGTPHIGTFTYDLTNVGFVAENVQDPDRVTLRQTSGADYRNLSNYGRLTWVKDTRFSLDRRWGAKIDAKWQGTAFKVPVLVQGGVADNTQVRITTGVSTGARKWLGTGPDGVFGNANDVPLDLGQFADSRLPNGWVHRGPTATVETGQWLDAA